MTNNVNMLCNMYFFNILKYIPFCICAVPIMEIYFILFYLFRPGNAKTQDIEDCSRKLVEHIDFENNCNQIGHQWYNCSCTYICLNDQSKSISDFCIVAVQASTYTRKRKLLYVITPPAAYASAWVKYIS